MSNVSTPMEIACPGIPVEPEDPDAYSESEPYSELLLETLEAADRVAETPVDVHSSTTADGLFAELLENWQ